MGSLEYLAGVFSLEDLGTFMLVALFFLAPAAIYLSALPSFPEERLARLRDRFGGKYGVEFRFGRMRLIASQATHPAPADLLEIARILWSENKEAAKSRDRFSVCDHRRGLCFVVMRERAPDGGGLAVVRKAGDPSSAGEIVGSSSLP